MFGGATVVAGLVVGTVLARPLGLGVAHACKCESAPSIELELREIVGDGDPEPEQRYWPGAMRLVDEGDSVWASFGEGTGFTAERAP